MTANTIAIYITVGRGSIQIERIGGYAPTQQQAQRRALELLTITMNAISCRLCHVDANGKAVTV